MTANRPADRLPPDVRSLVEQRFARARLSTPKRTLVRGQGPRPVSAAQQRMLFLEDLNPGLAAYNIVFTVRLDGPLNPDLLEAALRGVEDRHEVLRTTYARDAASDLQVVRPVGLSLRRIVSLDDTDAWLDQLVRAEFERPFDVRTGPVWRATLVQAGDALHYLALALHHIAFDGWSVDVLARELSAGYAALLTGAPVPAAPPVQYADFAAWQHEQIIGGGYDSQLAYWSRQLAGVPDRLELPTDQPPVSTRSGQGGTSHATVDPAVVAAVRSLARACSATPFMVLLAALHAFLHRYTGQPDVLVGTPVANRPLPDVEPLIGLFVNTVVIRAGVNRDLTFSQLLDQVRGTAAEACAHQDVPFERVVSELPLARNMANTPLFQVLFDWNTSPAGDDTSMRLGPVRMTNVDRYRPAAVKFDLTLAVSEHPDGLDLELKYSKDLWDESAARRALEHYLILLAAAVGDPGLSIGELPLLSGHEHDLVTRAWQGETQPFPGPIDLAAMVADRAAADGDAVALVFGGDRLTYRELDQRVNRMAQHLRALGAAADRPVAVLLPRSFDLVVAIVGSIRAGAPYLPLDVDHPPARIAEVISDAAASIVVTRADLTDLLAGVDTAPVLVDTDADRIAARSALCPPAGVLPDQLAYVLYTSGSSGRPKGVMVTHRAAHNQIQWQIARYGLDPSATVMLKTDVTFDSSVVEIFATLASGARLVIAEPGGHRDPRYIRDLMAAERVSYVRMVPTMLAAFLAYGGDALLPALRDVSCGGEVLTPELLARFTASLDARLHNAYGPTETAVNVAVDRCRPADGPRVPIGGPAGNVRCYVLDPDLRPQPIGVAGELYVGGVQLARGYLGHPGGTAEKFVPDPFGEPGSRLYRTGDRVCWRADGVLEFLDRIDRQVKLRGLRVELGEIEAVLAERCRDAAVLVRADQPGGPALVAYVTAGSAAVDPVKVRAWLRTRLPAYMVPATIIVLPALPPLPSGKVDYRRLPAPAAAAPAPVRADPPTTPTERRLAAIWSELLGISQVERGDDFFALGGHSMLAVRLVSRLRETTDRSVPLRMVFDAPTLAGLAGMLDREPPAKPVLPAVTPADGPVPELSEAEAGLWFVHQLSPDDPAYNVPVVSRLRGPLDATCLAEAVSALAARHASLRTSVLTRDGLPVRVVAASVDVPLPSHDLRSLPASEREQALADVLRRSTEAPFDLARGPLFRATLVALDHDEHILILTFHHVIVDGWSLAVLRDDLMKAYACRRDRRPVAWDSAPLSAGDYARWHADLTGGGRLDAELGYWRRRLADAPAGLSLPADRPRSARRSSAGEVHRFTVPAALAAGLRELTVTEGATPFMGLLAGYVALLARYSGTDDIVLALPVADRSRPELAPVVGLLVNTVLLRITLRPGWSFRELLRAVRTAVLDAYEHRQLPFPRLVDELGLDGLALTRYSVTIDQVTPEPAMLAGGIALLPEPFTPAYAKADLNVTFEDGPDGLTGSALYQAERFDRSRIERLSRHLVTLLARAVADPEEQLARLDLLDAGERLALTGTADGTAAAGCLHSLIDEQIGRTPDAVAIQGPGAADRLTYRELGRRADRLARYLSAVVRAGDVVGVGLGRGPNQAATVLAALRVGAAYVALDPRAPIARQQLLIADSGARVLLTEAALADRFAALPVRLIDVDAANGDWPALGTTEVSPASLAYVAYTSGSTGKPKGVLTSHAAAAQYLRDYLLPAYRIDAADTVLQLAPLAFDASIRDLLGPLAGGARVVLLDDEQAGDPKAIVDVIEAERVTCLLSVVPTLLRAVVAEAEGRQCVAAALRLVLTAGEVLDLGDCARAGQALPGRPLVVNQYGPTECTMTTTAWLAADAEAAGPAPVGTPVAGARVWVVDATGDLAPVGVPGEVWIGGARLAYGYHGQPGLTAERFVPDPFSGLPGARAYRTGDLGFWDTDDNLRFLGRRDDQVKIRGNRVEPAEIEIALRAVPGVVEAAVLAMRDDAPGAQLRLAAFITPDTLNVNDVRATLRDLLLEHMIPTSISAIPALPRINNNKVDRRALVRLQPAVPPSAPPRTGSERVVAAIFDAVLGADRVGEAPCGRDDDFFARGGHSLLSAQLVARLRVAFGQSVPLRTVFETRTVAALASWLDGAASAGLAAAPATVQGDDRLTPDERFIWDHTLREPNTAAYHISFCGRIVGELDEVALVRAIDAATARHAALRTRFPAVGGEPARVVEPVAVLPIARYSVDGHVDPAAAVAELTRTELRRPFDLEDGMPARATVIRCGPAEHVLMLTVHHIVADGWSLSVLQRDIGAYYAALTTNSTAALAPVRGFDTYAAAQLAHLDAAGHATGMRFWSSLLADMAPVLALPTDRPRPPDWQLSGATRRFTIDPEVTARVRALARNDEVTEFMVLFAVTQLWLAAQSGERRFLVAVPISNRPDTDAEAVVGPFANILPIPADLTGSPTFRGLLGRVRNTLLAAWDHQDVPFALLASAFAAVGSGRPPLCQVMFAMQNLPAGAADLGGTQLGQLHVDRGTCRYELHVRCQDTPDGLSGWIEYSTALFDPDGIERRLAALRQLVRAATARPDTPVEVLIEQLREET